MPSFLDVGCAAGNFTKIIETRKKRFIYLGLDISNVSIQNARKFAVENNISEE